MKKIAVITSGLLPMPAIKDGAIETLLQYTLDYNESNKNSIFDVYSIFDADAEIYSKKYNNTNYFYIKVNKLIEKIYIFLLKVLRKLKLNNDPNFKLLYIINVFKMLKKNSYDYIIVESENHFVNYLLKKTDTPIILYLHNDKLNKDVKNADFIAKNCFQIWTVSNYLRKQVLTINQKYNDKVKVIHNGIDIKQFSNIEKDNQYSDTLNFLFVGRIEKDKGTLELINAFNAMSNKNTKLFIVGATFHSSKKKTKYYEQVFKESLKRKEDIIFTGHIPHKNLNDIYKFIDVQIVPSRWEEPAGLVNIEAIAAGVGLIASNVGGIPEYVDDDTILIDNDKNFVNNLTKKMDTMKKNVKYHSDFCISNFSKEEYVKRYYKLIDDL